MNIAIICGGISTERNVSITGGLAVKSALEELGHNVILIDPAYGADGNNSPDFNNPDMSKETTLDDLLKFNLKSYLDCINSNLFDNIDVVFPVLHGRYGEDGTFQSLLEFRNIPYVGSKVAASALSSDKIRTKLILSSAGVLTPNWTTVNQKEINDENIAIDIRNSLGKQIVIKPNDQGSTIGLTIVKDGNLDEINKGLEIAAKYSDLILVETYIEGRELTVGIVGDEVLPVIEIIPKDGFYDYEHKYQKGKTEYICPAELTDDVAEFTQSMALSAYRAVGCSGFARVDFRLDEDNQPFCLEINSIPGFTSQSLVPMAAKQIGLSFTELCQKLIDLAIEEFRYKK